jgi:hypothetical protein
MKNLRTNLLVSILLTCSLIAQEDIAITVTNTNLGLIREKRTIDLKKGIQEISLVEIPSEIDATSVLVENDSKKFKVLEQNYEFDLINVEKLLEKSIGRRIKVIHPQSGTVEGALLASSRGNIILKDRDEMIQILPRNDKQNIQLVEYESKGPGFISRPTLVWKVDAANSGKHSLNMSYLTKGMTWRADYVGLLNKMDTKLSIAGWVTVTNKSGRKYENASLKLMAGDISVVKPRRPKVEVREMFAQSDAGGGFEEKPFFEYHLYTLDRKTDLQNNQIKQIQLFPEVESKIKKKYQVRSNNPKKVRIVVSLENSENNNLGIPLPEGRIRIYKSDGKDIEFVGENLIEHTAKNEKLDIELGSAFDIVSERNILSTDRKLKRARRQKVEYIIRNHKDSEVAVEIIEQISPYYEVELHESTIPVRKKTADMLKFLLLVPADQEKTLTMDYSTRW